MAKRTKTERRKARRNLAWGLGFATAIAFLVLLVLPGADAGDLRLEEPTAEPASVGRRSEPKPDVRPEASYSSAPREESPDAKPRVTQPRKGGARPAIAIVIDDVGHSMGPVEDLLDLDLDLTYAVIPHLTHSRASARRLEAHGREIILHQPMEPLEYPGVPLERGGLLVGMLPAEVHRILRENLESVPGATGVNNHKGSRATADPGLMTAFLEAVKEQGLYFLDSRTTAETVAEETARRLRVPTGRRHVFLDNEDDVEAIHRQLRELIDTALEEGEAIGIGHARPSMVYALERARPWLTDGRVRIVPASHLVR